IGIETSARMNFIVKYLSTSAPTVTHVTINNDTSQLDTRSYELTRSCWRRWRVAVGMDSFKFSEFTTEQFTTETRRSRKDEMTNVQIPLTNLGFCVWSLVFG